MKNKNIISGLLERKVLVIIIVIMLFITGGFCYYKMPKQHFPEVVLPLASVTVIYPGATAEDMEQLVAEKVEHVCMELDGFDSRSTVLAVYFRDGLNVVSLGDEINEVIDTYNSNLPEGISVNKIFMQPDQVQDSINGFLVNLFESIALVIIVVMIGMSFRNAIIVSVAIPLSIFINFICIYFMGYEIQFVSLASLIVVLGMLVDNSVVISDAIQKNLDAGMDRNEAIVKGTSNMIVPVFISMLTTSISFASLLTLPGAYKQLAITFPVVIVCCLVASFLVSVCVTPIMSRFFLKKTKENKEGKKNLFRKSLRLGLQPRL